MTGSIDIPAHERPTVRVFALSMAAGEAEALKDPGALARVLGAEVARPGQTEIASVGDVATIGLTGYLAEGYGVKPEAARSHRDRLNALTGHVLILRSSAFAGQPVTLTPDPRLTLIATLPEGAPPPPPMEPIRSKGATGTLSGGRQPDGDTAYHASRRTLLVGLAVAAALALIVILVIRGGI